MTLAPDRTAPETTILKGIRFRAILGLSFFIMFGYGLVVPTLPLFARQFGVGDAKVGLLITVFATTRLIADLFAGALIDRYGERKMAAIGAAIVGISSASAGTAGSFMWLVILRGFGGIGSAFFLGSLMSSVIGNTSAEDRGKAMSLFQGVIGVGLILGPVFGGLVGIISLRAPLFVYGAICLASAPIALAALGPSSRGAGLEDACLVDQTEQECAVPAPVLPAWKRLRPLLRDSAYVGALVAGAAGFFVAGGLDTVTSAFWRFQLHHSKSSVGIPFMIFGIAGVAAIWHAGKLADRRGRKFATVPAMFAMAIGLAALGFSGNATVFVLIMAAIGLAYAYQRPGPSAVVADVSTPDSRGIAVSGFRVATDLGALIGPITVGVVAQSLGRRAGFITIGVAVALGAIVVAFSRETAPTAVAAATPQA